MGQRLKERLRITLRYSSGSSVPTPSRGGSLSCRSDEGVLKSTVGDVIDPKYHTGSWDYPSECRDFHHDNNDCRLGKQIKPEDRQLGTGDKPLCRYC